MQLIGWYVGGIKPESYQSILLIIIINMFIESFIHFQMTSIFIRVTFYLVVKKSIGISYKKFFFVPTFL